MQEVWIEKYRPRVLDDVVGQTDIVNRLKAYVRQKNMPHLLFAGPAGTGKTTSSIALAREMFGTDSWRDNFQELNASDERGIGVVRTKIKDFARTSPIGEASFKIIFLDEADALTPEAQAALRRTMEKYSHICRFVLSCNYSSKIIEPIQSRCAVFRYKPLTGEDITVYLKRVAAAEGLEVTSDAYDALVYIADGDMRKATTTLQVAAAFNIRIDSDTLYRASSTAEPEEVKEMVSTALHGEFLKARTKLDDLIINKGLSGEDIIKQIHKSVFELGISEFDKVQLVDRIGEAEFRLVEGSNDRIQLESLLAHFVLQGKRMQSR